MQNYYIQNVFLRNCVLYHTLCILGIPMVNTFGQTMYYWNLVPHTVYVEDGAYAKVHKLCAHVVPLPWKNNNWDLTVLVNPNSQHTWIIQLYLPSFPICYWACHCEHNINLTRKVWHMPVYAETCTIHNMTSCVPWPLLIHNHPQVYTWYNATSLLL